MKRRLWIPAVAGVAAALVIALLVHLVSGPPVRGRGRQWLAALHAEAVRRVEADQLARPDGYVYTVDVAQLMTAAALAGDRDLYDALHTRLTRRAVVNELGVPFTAYFVAWRWADPDTPLDATGTTEALRLAEALWVGGAAFDRPGDRDLAVLILEAYLRHAAVDQRVWFIRNYFNLQTGAFATNSYLIDYDPDLLSVVAAARDHAELAEAAEHSVALITAAQTPAGLLHSIVQPELRTLMPGMPPIFSPNNVEQLGNVAGVAARCTTTAPAISRRILDFAMARVPDLRLYYDAATGEPLSDRAADLAARAALLRTAVGLDDDDAADALLDQLVAAGARTNPAKLDLYTISEVLLALHAALDAPGPVGEHGEAHGKTR